MLAQLTSAAVRGVDAYLNLRELWGSRLAAFTQDVVEQTAPETIEWPDLRELIRDAVAAERIALSRLHPNLRKHFAEAIERAKRAECEEIWEVGNAVDGTPKVGRRAHCPSCGSHQWVESPRGLRPIYAEGP